MLTLHVKLVFLWQYHQNSSSINAGFLWLLVLQLAFCLRLKVNDGPAVPSFNLILCLHGS